MNNYFLAIQADIDKYNKMFSKGENRMKTYPRFNKIALVISLVVILVCLAMVENVSAEDIGYYTNNYVTHFGVFPVKNDYIRSEACHTLVLWGGDESIESESCPIMENNTDKKDKDTTSIVTIPDKSNNPPVVVNVPEPKEDNPPVIDTPKDDKPKKDNGNHYGNTTPDNNDNDVKNKFNGQDNPHNH